MWWLVEEPSRAWWVFEQLAVGIACAVVAIGVGDYVVLWLRQVARRG